MIEYHINFENRFLANKGVRAGMIFLEQYDELFPGMGFSSMRDSLCSSSYPGEAEILEYLRNGNVHIATAARLYDCFTQECISGYGCLVHMNDRKYSWTTKVIYYIEQYHLRLPYYIESDILQKAKRNT
ncbi:MAG: hypothetical protein IKU70_08040 [Clostridia bacterium]|nr:hypothetical protein [Clostridia bacterium]